MAIRISIPGGRLRIRPTSVRINTKTISSFVIALNRFEMAIIGTFWYEIILAKICSLNETVFGILKINQHSHSDSINLNKFQLTVVDCEPKSKRLNIIKDVKSKHLRSNKKINPSIVFFFEQNEF